MELNKVYCMDNLELLRQMKDESVDLIYCDILYNTGKKFKNYDDRLGTPQQAMEWYRPRLVEMRRVLKDTGSIYIHCDYHLNSYLRVELDNIFGVECFRNELIRINCNPKNNSNNFGRIYDNILYYVKNNKKFYFKTPTEQKSEDEIKRQYTKIYHDGRRYTTTPLHAKGETKNGESGKDWASLRGIIPIQKGHHWRYTHKTLNELDSSGLIEWSKNNVPRKIIFADERQDKNMQNIIEGHKSKGYENNYVKYDTQKPKSLSEVIIKASSKEGELVADFFCGSGTSMVVAKELGRKYIGCDINPKAVEITNKRLIDMN